MLVGVLYSKTTEVGGFDAELLSEVKSILSENGVEVDGRFVTSETKDMLIPEVTPVTSRNSELVKTLEKNGELNDNGDFLIEGSTVSVYEDVVHFENTEGGENSAKTPEGAAEEYFSRFGLNLKGCLVGKDENGGGAVLRYVQKYDGFEVFGSYAEVKVEGGEVKSANVVWYEISDKRAPKTRTVSTAEALIDFAADKTRGEKACKVESVVLGYVAETDGSGTVRNTQMIPSVKVETSIGSSFYYDIRNPE